MKNKQEKESGTLKYKLSLSFKSAKFGSKTTNCTLAASGDRELEGHRIANIFFPFTELRQFFLLERSKMVLFFERYSLSVPQT